MEREQILDIVMDLRTSQSYARLECFTAFLEANIKVTRRVRRARASFIILRRRINRIMRLMKQWGVPDGARMNFYRLIRRLMPAFSRVSSLHL